MTGDRTDFGHLFETRVHDVLVITPLRLAEILAATTTDENEADE